MTENNFRSHFSPFQINMQLFFFTKWLPAAIMDNRKSLLIAFLDVQRQRQRQQKLRRQHNQKHNNPEIFKFWGYNKLGSHQGVFVFFMRFDGRQIVVS